MDEKTLRSLWLFEGLSNDELKLVARFADELDVPEGKALAKQDSFAHEFFVIEDGAATVTKDGEHINDLGPGDFFGEIGILASERRTATVTASTPMRVIVMHEREFRSLEHDRPAVAEKIRAAIRARLDA
jgi:CRP/FNR family transcriptional regulator, cyclic AMP receptor protein